jgi:hypothetical protein
MSKLDLRIIKFYAINFNSQNILFLLSWTMLSATRGKSLAVNGSEYYELEDGEKICKVL